MFGPNNNLNKFLSNDSGSISYSLFMVYFINNRGQSLSKMIISHFYFADLACFVYRPGRNGFLNGSGYNEVSVPSIQEFISELLIWASFFDNH